MQVAVAQVRGEPAVLALKAVETPETITIQRGDVPVLVYRKTSPAVPEGVEPVYQRSGFLHPVHAPSGGTVTTAFPSDHLHQHGIFSAWTKTAYGDRAIDFWNLGGKTGRVLHEGVVSLFGDARTTGFQVKLLHRAEQEPVIDILREEWRVTVHDTGSGYHCFDIETTQQALTDVPLVIRLNPYGGMAARGPTDWLLPNDQDLLGGKCAGDAAAGRSPGDITNDLRSDRVKGNHERARWVAMTGLRDGQPVTLAVLCHAGNFRAPQAARLHPTKPYFVFSPCVDGEFTIERTKPYHARYRYLITDAAPDPAWLDAQWQSWCGP